MPFGLFYQEQNLQNPIDMHQNMPMGFIFLDIFIHYDIYYKINELNIYCNMNEVRYNGRSYHGDNCCDWYSVMDLRDKEMHKHMDNGDDAKADRASNRANRDFCNAFELDSWAHDDDYYDDDEWNDYNESKNMNKKLIRLTESDLKQIVKESVNKILNEAYGTMPKDDIKRVANLDAASQSRFDERGEEIEDIKNDEFSRRLQDLQRDLTKCWWMANSLGSHMKHNEFLGKASERYANYVMDNISNASDGLDRIIAIAKMKIGQ